MLAGLVVAYDAVEFFASGSESFSMSDTAQGLTLSSTLLGKQTYNAPVPALVQKFIGIERTGSVAVTTGTNTGQVLVGIIPDGMGGYADSYTASVAVGAPWTASVVLADYREYIVSGGNWKATWSGFTVKIQGSTVATIGAGSWDNTGVPGSRMAPTGQPFVGKPPELSCTIAPASSRVPGPVPGDTSAFSHVYSGSASIEGGYHVKELGAAAYTAFPVNLSVLTGPTSGCDCEAGGLPGISAGDTASGSASSSFYQESSCTYLGRFPIVTGSPVGENGLTDLYYTKGDQNAGESSVMMLPSVPRSIKRFAPDYAAVWFRGGLPMATSK